MDNQPLISVIVPVYKVEAFLRPCVDSILAQTVTDFELILVDDGSPDNCGAICDEYAERDNRVQVIHQENGGLSAARNAGLDWVATQRDCRWVTFIDSDDLVQPDYLSFLYQTAIDQHAQVAACGFSEFQENELPNPTANIDAVQTFSGHDAVLNLYSERPYVSVSACGKLFLMDLFSGIRFPSGKLHEDQAVTPIIISRASTVAASRYSPYCYRLRYGSIMHSRFSAKRYDDVAAVDQCISYFEENGVKDLIVAARKKRQELIVLYSLSARKDGVYSEVPKQYRMSKHNALKWMMKNLSDDLYTYRLSSLFPKRLRPHVYWRKVKKTLHIPCN